MKLTGSEKLILIMLSKIHEQLDIRSDIDPKFVQSAINSGNSWISLCTGDGLAQAGRLSTYRIASVQLRVRHLRQNGHAEVHRYEVVSLLFQCTAMLSFVLLTACGPDDPERINAR